MPPITCLTPFHGFLVLKKLGEDVDDSFPDEVSRPGRIFNGPRGPVLDLGVQPPQ